MITWQAIGAFQVASTEYRLEHVGLADNGKHCFMATDENWMEWVWDVHKNDFVWFKNYSGEDSLLRPDIQEWIEGGYYEPLSDTLHGKYRILGTKENHPLLKNSTYGLNIASVAPATGGYDIGVLELVDSKSGELMHTLEFTDRSGEFAIASFTRGGSMLVAVTPWDVTFFEAEVD